MNFFNNKKVKIFSGSQSADEIIILENVNNLGMQFLIVENCFSKLSLRYNKINLVLPLLTESKNCVVYYHY